MSPEQELNMMRLYMKERDYERSIFGEYENDPSLSFPSFLVFLKRYIDKAIEAYAGVWEKDLPPWLLTCKEFENNGVAPVKAYEEVIKIMALAGASIESFAKIDANLWRANPEEDSRKWKDICVKETKTNEHE